MQTNNLPARDAIWPSRRRQGLARKAFCNALLSLARPKVRPAPSKPVVARVQRRKPESLGSILASALKVLNAIGIPQLRRPGLRAASIIDFAAEPFPTLYLEFKGARSRLEDALDGLTELLRAVGRDVAFRELWCAANIGTYRGSLRLAPVRQSNPRPGLTRWTPLQI